MHEKKTISAPSCLTLLVFLLIFSSPVLAQEAVNSTPVSWVSILPPLLAIVLALYLRQVIPALFFGVWFGAWAINGFGLFGRLPPVRPE